MSTQILRIHPIVLDRIHRYGEAAYPEEGAGFLLGELRGDTKIVSMVLPVENSREDAARHNRYLVSPLDYARAEETATQQELDVLGVFHSHPDHPNRPSEFDREWAMPWFSYLITSVQAGKAVESRSWQLAEDRSQFIEETLVVTVEETDPNQTFETQEE
jgi:proteasome lid subunit RPN8/RPN11